MKRLANGFLSKALGLAQLPADSTLESQHYKGFIKDKVSEAFDPISENAVDLEENKELTAKLQNAIVNFSPGGDLNELNRICTRMISPYVGGLSELERTVGKYSS